MTQFPMVYHVYLSYLKSFQIKKEFIKWSDLLRLILTYKFKKEHVSMLNYLREIGIKIERKRFVFLFSLSNLQLKCLRLFPLETCKWI